MKTYALILLLSLITSVCGAHDDWVSGSTDRQHLSGADLNNYLHGHKETVNSTVRTGYWDYDPDVDNAWEKTKANWEASGCITQDANGNNLYDKDCYNDWIRDGNLKPTPEKPKNNPVNHLTCYGDGTEHFHRVDANGHWHGIDHSGLSLVGGIFTAIHRHPACEEPPEEEIPCHGCEAPQRYEAPQGRENGISGRSIGDSAQSFVPITNRRWCPVGWKQGAPKVVLYAIEIAIQKDKRGFAFVPTAIEFRSQGVDTLDGYSVRLGTVYNLGRRRQALPDGLAFNDNQLRIETADLGGIVFPMKITYRSGRRVPSFDYRLYDTNNQRVDMAIACYQETSDDILTISERQTARLERNIELDWTADFYRSAWRLVEMDAPSAPSLKRTVVGTWATLKRQ